MRRGDFIGGRSVAAFFRRRMIFLWDTAGIDREAAVDFENSSPQRSLGRAHSSRDDFRCAVEAQFRAPRRQLSAPMQRAPRSSGS